MRDGGLHVGIEDVRALPEAGDDCALQSGAQLTCRTTDESGVREPEGARDDRSVGLFAGSRVARPHPGFGGHGVGDRGKCAAAAAWSDSRPSWLRFADATPSVPELV